MPEEHSVVIRFIITTKICFFSYIYIIFSGVGWKYLIKYKGLDCVTSSLNKQQTYRCHLTVIAS